MAKGDVVRDWGWRVGTVKSTRTRQTRHSGKVLRVQVEWMNGDVSWHDANALTKLTQR